MAAFRILVRTIVATFFFCSLINAAVVNNLIYADDLAEVNDVGDRAESYVAFPENYRARRYIESKAGSDSVKMCSGTTPCGWAVYIPFTRRVDYFMRNTCNCPPLAKCIRMDDDLSVSAYVYRCRTNATESDIESPNENNTN